jgi:tripartite-type tricarboxylate transporter receptor subunit TctC
MKSIFALFLVLAQAVLPHAVRAQASDYPNKPIRFIAVGAPGSISDIVPRILAQELSAGLGQSVVVDNRPGGSGQIASIAAANSPADGYTMVLNAVGSHVIAPLLGKITFDPVKDFIPIALAASMPLVLVVDPASTPVTSVKQLVELAKSKPGTLSYGSMGYSSTPSIATQLLQKAAGIELIHVPYKGTAAAIQDISGGRLTMLFDTVGTALPHVKSGKLRPLAVSSPRRSAVLPDVPTMQELGFAGFDVELWYGVWVPANTPADRVKRLEAEFAKVLEKPSVVERLQGMGLGVQPIVGEKFAAYQEREFAKWRGITADLNIKPD